MSQSFTIENSASQAIIIEQGQTAPINIAGSVIVQGSGQKWQQQQSWQQGKHKKWQTSPADTNTLADSPSHSLDTPVVVDEGIYMASPKPNSEPLSPYAFSSPAHCRGSPVAARVRTMDSGCPTHCGGSPMAACATPEGSEFEGDQNIQIENSHSLSFVPNLTPSLPGHPTHCGGLPHGCPCDTRGRY